MVDIFVIWILDGLGLCVAVDVELEIDNDLLDKVRFNTDDGDEDDRRRLDGDLIVCERPKDES